MKASEKKQQRFVINAYLHFRLWTSGAIHRLHWFHAQRFREKLQSKLQPASFRSALRAVNWPRCPWQLTVGPGSLCRTVWTALSVVSLCVRQSQQGLWTHPVRWRWSETHIHTAGVSPLISNLYISHLRQTLHSSQRAFEVVCNMDFYHLSGDSPALLRKYPCVQLQPPKMYILSDWRSNGPWNCAGKQRWRLPGAGSIS